MKGQYDLVFSVVLSVKSGCCVISTIFLKLWVQTSLYLHEKGCQPQKRLGIYALVILSCCSFVTAVSHH